ncbi:hypothetical protein P8A18_33105 (plasmid) [Streptomyces castrisilvae]|uniref:Uncharacterized protein n=1 Tax=Streptomyces castrisilvae TaxID=3033811 RepID=A0ABY9HWI5_9ACTN|nr:hypothetical protein [Streptomyces sp. Mut1]WLQ38368.1 hypothetical protein P8A18_33105 [Streptomyces sp. Mut1]
MLRNHSTPSQNCSTGSAYDLINCGDTQEYGRFFASLLRLDLRNLFFCGSDADAELLDIAEPSLAFGFRDPIVEVVSDLFKSGLFSGADDEDGAANVPLTELDLAPFEVNSQ